MNPNSIPDFSIIIVTWNALHHLKTYLPSVWKHSHDQAEILIADNASDDGTGQWISDNYPDIRIITLKENYGYCGGNNRAARQARGKYLLFLNNDVEVSSGWLNPLYDELQNDTEVAAVQPKILSWTAPSHFEYAGAAGGFLDRHAYPFCRGRMFDTVEKDTGQYDSPMDIAWASGAAMAVRSELFHMAGGFDESFEFHMEEIDLCWQFRNQGFRIRCNPQSVVYHLGGGSLPVDSPRKTYYNFRNNLKMIVKNSAARQLLPRLLARLALDEIAMTRALLRFRFREAFAISRAHCNLIRALPGLLDNRMTLQSDRNTASDNHILKPYSLLWQYFFRNRKTFQTLPDTGN